ncbi:hypothetical protein QJS10_CPB04g01256 [Acorus calamus]|uniref:Uncharacterized protein n=1 Tax=Acorus calamus TaxID=4465 RepID=A0AAV9F486_ACOCL|nr:hypothetical protein QJS10_CPB04g01256 [Acorus calamus]
MRIEFSRRKVILRMKRGNKSNAGSDSRKEEDFENLALYLKHCLNIFDIQENEFNRVLQIQSPPTNKSKFDEFLSCPGMWKWPIKLNLLNNIMNRPEKIKEGEVRDPRGIPFHKVNVINTNLEIYNSFHGDTDFHHAYLVSPGGKKEHVLVLLKGESAYNFRVHPYYTVVGGGGRTDVSPSFKDIVSDSRKEEDFENLALYLEHCLNIFDIQENEFNKVLQIIRSPATNKSKSDKLLSCPGMWKWPIKLNLLNNIMNRMDPQVFNLVDSSNFRVTNHHYEDNLLSYVKMFRNTLIHPKTNTQVEVILRMERGNTSNAGIPFHKVNGINTNLEIYNSFHGDTDFHHAYLVSPGGKKEHVLVLLIGESASNCIIQEINHSLVMTPRSDSRNEEDFENLALYLEHCLNIFDIQENEFIKVLQIIRSPATNKSKSDKLLSCPGMWKWPIKLNLLNNIMNRCDNMKNVI